MNKSSLYAGNSLFCSLSNCLGRSPTGTTVCPCLIKLAFSTGLTQIGLTGFGRVEESTSYLISRAENLTTLSLYSQTNEN